MADPPFVPADTPQVCLSRRPGTPAAKVFTAALVAEVASHTDRARPWSRKGLATLERDLGAVLAGIMRSGEGRPVRVPRSTSSPLWIGAPIGRDRTWRIVDALCHAGLVVIRGGIRKPALFGGWDGAATAVQPTRDLSMRAASYGLVPETRKEDWRADPTQWAAPSVAGPKKLVTCSALAGLDLAMTPGMEAEGPGWSRTCPP